MSSLGIQCVFCLRLRKSAEGAGRGTTAVYLNNQLEPVHTCTTSRCCLLYCSTSERVATGWLRSNPLFSRGSFQPGHKCSWWLEGKGLDCLRLVAVGFLGPARAGPAEGKAEF